MADQTLQGMFEAVRDACPRGLWARGAGFAKAGAVTRDPDDGGGVVLRVRDPAADVAPTVVLYPDDAEWDCDCGSRIDACAHAAAAVIALQAGLDAPSARAAGTHLRYRFHRDGASLALERFAGEHRVTGSITALADIEPTRADLDVDDRIRDGRLRYADFVDILGSLDGAADVELEGVPVYTSADPVLPVGIVSDRGAGVRLEVVASPSITEIVGSGVALCGDTLQPLGHPEITGERLERLPFVKEVAPPEYAAFVTEFLPALERDIPIEINTTRLPEITEVAQPRIELEVAQGAQLAVTPTLVYGRPPIAVIEGDAMRHLRGPAPIRDRAREKQLLAELRDELNLAPGRTVEFAGIDARRFADRLRAWRGDSVDHAGHDFVLPGSLIPRVDVSRGFDLVFEAGEDETGEATSTTGRRATAAAVIGAWQSGLELVPLDGGGWARLPADWLERYGDLVADLLAAREPDGSLPKYALPGLADLCDELGEQRPPILGSIAELLDGFDGIPPAALPTDFAGTLRDYQQRGVDWLCCLRAAGLGAVLADDMGLGKTVQALCAVTGRTLVVCPTSVVPVWESEIRRFRPGLRVAVYHGSDRELDDTADITLTTYALLRIDSKKLTAIEWGTAVLDEAQAIKNQQSQVARAAHRLRAGFRMALSGTPVENRLDELWSVFHFANRGLLGTRPYFQRRYARPIARAEPDAARRLRDRIRPFLLRRLKAEVAPELPPRTDTILYCDLSEHERNVYDAIRAATSSDVVTSLRAGGSVMEALEALLRLRQAACHPSLVPGQHADTSAKIAALLDALERVVGGGNRALVFSQWTSLLDLVEPHLRAAGHDFVRLDGTTRDRGAVVDAFQAEGGPPVMLVSLKAGGTGLNLTAADHVFLLDPWWNPAVEDQAADRTHRIGQTRPVMVYRLVALDTVEQRILALQERKRALADAALGEGDRAAGLTRDDLLELLAD
jgi:superfamily II DNA or RNA helicase